MRPLFVCVLLCVAAVSSSHDRPPQWDPGFTAANEQYLAPFKPVP